MFIQKSVQDETISQYKVQGSKLVSALLSFIREEYSGLSGVENEDDGNVAAVADESGDEADIVDDLLKIRSSKRSSNGLLDRLTHPQPSSSTREPAGREARPAFSW